MAELTSALLEHPIALAARRGPSSTDRVMHNRTTTLNASAEDLADLHDGSLKVILGGPVDPTAINSLLGDGIKVLLLSADAANSAYWISPISPTATKIRKAPGSQKIGFGSNSSVLEALPSNLAAMWALDSHSHDVLQTFSAWARERFDAKLPDVGVGDQVGLLSALIQHMFLATEASAKRNIALENALSVLRSEYEETREVLYRMQELLWNVHDNPVRLTFASKLGTHCLAFETSTRALAVILEQQLPISGRGLAGFDVHAAEAAEGPGYLRCVLSDAADQSTIGEWTVDYNEISPGWLNFSLPYNLDINPPHMDIRIECVGGHKPPSLTLAGGKVVGLPSVSCNGKQLADQTLAMRVWVGFPGIRNEAVGSHIHGHGRDQQFQYILPPSALAGIRRAVAHEADFDYLNLRPDGSVLLHPLVNRIASAVVRSAVAKGATGLEAIVSIEDNCPSAIEFAFSVVPKSRKMIFGRQDPDWQKIGQFSEWHRVGESFVKQAISLDFMDPLSEEHDLYLLTRVPDGGSVDFGQAIFHRFVVSVQGQLARYAHSGGPQAISQNATVTHRTQRGRGAGVTIHDLDPEILRGLTPTQRFSVGFQHVQCVDGDTALVHPVQGETSIAVIPRCLPPSSVIVMATVGVRGNRFTSPVEFALGVSSQSNAQTETEIRLSDWVTITKPGETSELTLDLGSHGSSQRLSLYLLTRVPNEQSVDYASAYFHNIKIGVSRLS